jgi:transcriptional regulator with XRE-family HTH domain
VRAPGPAAVPAPAREQSRARNLAHEQLGRHIKFIRVSLGLTLKDLEGRGGISATYVSEIERGKASPTIRALGRIAQALGLSAASLLEWPTLPEASIGRGGTRGNRVLRWDGGTLEPLTERAEGTSIGAYLLLLPVRREPALRHAHEGEEWLTLLSGVAEIKVGEERFLLREGDSLHFRAQAEHSYANPGSDSALLLVACRPRLAL